MKYEDLRPLIQDGDIVFIGRPISIWSKITTVVTRSPYYHVAVAFWMRDPNYKSRPTSAEASHGGRRVVSCSAYLAHDMTVLRTKLNWEDAADMALDATGSVPYSIPDYLGIGLRELWGIKVPNFKGQVCSEFVATVLDAFAGYSIPAQISPGNLYKELATAELVGNCTATT